MPAYSFEAIDASGQSREGVLEADTARSARSLLRAQALIHGKAAESKLFEAGARGGLRSMREDGERLVQAGITSRAELLRVTRD